MTPLQADARTPLHGLLGMVGGLPGDSGTRLEQRVDEIKTRIRRLAEETHRSSVPRKDCPERTGRILGGLKRAEEKADRMADALRTGGR